MNEQMLYVGVEVDAATETRAIRIITPAAETAEEVRTVLAWPAWADTPSRVFRVCDLSPDVPRY